MIFCSVGTQLPFSRLVDYIIKWVSELESDVDKVIIQSGEKRYFDINQNLQFLDFIKPADFTNFFESADVIISHAGMGNIIRALELAKPIVIVPRLSSHNEHRNDHQVDTAARFSSFDSVFVATNYNEFTLAMKLAAGFDNKDVSINFDERTKLIDFVNDCLRN